MTGRMDTKALKALAARGNIKPDVAIDQGTLDAAAAAPALAAEVLELRAERDAIAAVAFEASAKLLQDVADNWDCGHMEARLCDCLRDAEQWGFAADEVRTLTHADAKAALERMIEAAVETAIAQGDRA